ncbi:MAG: GspH/FimT family pseudopilin [Parvularculaceae bacterium]|nr:GspH/FimT family pseudopilin [Parvularculaceae bacterium]
MVGRQIERPRERGLTLVELLVVIVILALASSVVLLNAPPSRPKVKEDAERFAARLALAMDEAIATGGVMRISIDAKGYQFERMQAGEWTPLDDDRIFGRRDFDKGSLAKVEIKDAAYDNARALGGEERPDAAEEGDDKEKTEIALDPLGVQTAFSVRFSSADGAFVVTVDEGGGIAVNADA